MKKYLTTSGVLLIGAIIYGSYTFWNLLKTLDSDIFDIQIDSDEE